MNITLWYHENNIWRSGPKGFLSFNKDAKRKAFFFQVVSENNELVLDHKFHSKIPYYIHSPIFHFFGKEKIYGLNFNSEKDAENFRTSVVQRSKARTVSPVTPENPLLENERNTNRTSRNERPKASSLSPQPNVKTTFLKSIFCTLKPKQACEVLPEKEHIYSVPDETNQDNSLKKRSHSSIDLKRPTDFEPSTRKSNASIKTRADYASSLLNHTLPTVSPLQSPSREIEYTCTLNITPSQDDNHYQGDYVFVNQIAGQESSKKPIGMLRAGNENDYKGTNTNKSGNLLTQHESMTWHCSTSLTTPYPGENIEGYYSNEETEPHESIQIYHDVSNFNNMEASAGPMSAQSTVHSKTNHEKHFDMQSKNDDTVYPPSRKEAMKGINLPMTESKQKPFKNLQISKANSNTGTMEEIHSTLRRDSSKYLRKTSINYDHGPSSTTTYPHQGFPSPPRFPKPVQATAQDQDSMEGPETDGTLNFSMKSQINSEPLPRPPPASHRSLPLPPPPPEFKHDSSRLEDQDSRSGLLESIKRGISLKKVQNNVETPSNSKGAPLALALKSRYEKIQISDSDYSDEENTWSSDEFEM